MSNLSFLSKIIEKVVLFQMSDHLCSNSLLNPFQSAYKPRHSTETALLEIVNNLLNSLDNGNISVVTFLDLLAAFGTTDHNNLLSHLENVFGIYTVLHCNGSPHTCPTELKTCLHHQLEV